MNKGHFCLVTLLAMAVQAQALSLRYDQAPSARKVSNQWMEYGLPIGNGHLGGMVMGGISVSEVQLNEKTFWTGSPKSKGAYQNLGYLRIGRLETAHQADDVPSKYSIELDLDDAIVTERWTDISGATFSREYMASNPDDCIFIRLTASQPGLLNERISLRGAHGETVAYSGHIAEMGTKLDVVTSAVTLLVADTDGTTMSTSDGIEVRDASEIIIYLAASTDYDPTSASYVKTSSTSLASAQAMRIAVIYDDWPTLKRRHSENYQSLYGRMSLELIDADVSEPTDSLIMRYSNGASETEQRYLEQLYFAYCRYLLIASSRGMASPANLQGLWNNSNTPPWSSDIHANINVQMNYWPAEVTNLGDAVYPLLEWIYNNAVVQTQWREYGEYVAGGGVLCSWGLNIFNFWQKPKASEMYCAAPAWLCWHLWQHYLYTCDEDFLRERALPVMLLCIDFWKKRLVRDKKDGLWVCPQEWSPEQGPLDDGTAHSQQCVWMLFDYALKAINLVGEKDAGVTAEEVRQIRNIFNELDNGLHTEIYDGAYGNSINGVRKGDVLLREWKNYATTSAASERQHRHVSHLMCLYPFNMVVPGHELMPAVVNSMMLRGERNTGWAMAWKMSLWARAQRADMAYAMLRGALNHALTYNVSTDPKNAGVYYNLLDAHPPFQIDGNFGTCAGIAEMLMQSYGDTIRLLPALPAQWARSGRVRGMRAEGGFELDFQWQDAKITRLKLHSLSGKECHLQLPIAQDATINDITMGAEGNVAECKAEEGRLNFSTTAECDYELTLSDWSAICNHASSETVNSKSVNSKWYDLSGRRLVVPPKKGAFILGGKTVFLR